MTKPGSAKCWSAYGDSTQLNFPCAILAQDEPLINQYYSSNQCLQ